MNLKDKNQMESKKEEKNQTYYREVFDSVYASEELKKRIQNINSNSRRKTFALRKLANVAAAIVIVFCSINVVSYAATGEAWIATVLEQTIAYINENPQDVEMIKSVSEDGATQYSYVYPEDDGATSVFLVGKEESGEEASEQESETLDVQFPDPSIVTEADRIYLVVDEIRIDITDDIADEECEGTFTWQNQIWRYEIKGNAETNSISITPAAETETVEEEN
ncbi:MAG: hypothetical protein LIP10_09625 [Clostridiales bacterium]|nr:hypothetical protein [Clostridiales bacterium]